MKVYDTGLICGRFQTFHKGHERLVDTGLLLCDRLLILNNTDRYIHKNPEIMIYGNDESRSNWFDKKDLANTAELIMNRYDMPISATMVRTAMAKDDRKLWMSYVNPRLHKMYDELREELMTVEFYKNLAKE